MESQREKKKDLMLQQSNLPHDLITQNILIRLPIEPLLRFKSVSTQWYSTISSLQFASTHFKFHRPSPVESVLIQSEGKFQVLSYENGESNLVNLEVDFDEIGREKFVLVGSCNGLVCVGSTSGRLFIIWNPITREFRKFRKCPFDDPEHYDFSTNECIVVWGFGYVSATEDYKVVRIYKKVLNHRIRVHVFSFRSNKWKRIDEDPSNNFSDLRLAGGLYRQGVLVNEVLYLMGDGLFQAIGTKRKILSFDLALELFDTFPHLDVSTPYSWYATQMRIDEFLCVVKGCLSKYDSSEAGTITILKQPGETEQILVSYGVFNSNCYKLIGFAGNDMFFAHYFCDQVGSPHLGIIDPSSQPMNLVPPMTLKKGLKTEIISYSESLISPAAATGHPNRIVR